MKDSAAASKDSVDGNTNDGSSYESALKALFSPGIHLATTKEDIARSALRRTRTVSDMRWYWNKILQQQQQQKGPSPPKKPLLIHVTGTKGKGSTSCMCEAVLREHGYSTGLFTSPHLMDIRERIRWNGRPIHPSVFATVYWKIRRALEADDPEFQDSDNDPPPKLPGYFRMLTLMGLYTFLHELSGKVDAIILEVGMGGRYDATNFLDASTEHFRTVANGVTLLDLDHTRILGDTLEKIAWEKGGIFSVDKLNPEKVSQHPSQNTVTTEEIREKELQAKEVEASVDETNFLSPHNIMLDSNTQGVVEMMKSCSRVEGKGSELSLVDATGSNLQEALRTKGLSLGLAGSHQYGNATLAVALCQAVADKPIEMDSSTTLGALALAKWPGRCQTLELSNTSDLRFYLDGAHTPQSLEATVDWLCSKSIPSGDSAPVGLPILVFNCSHERNPVELLELFLKFQRFPQPTTTKTSRGRRFSRVYFAKSDSSRPSPVAKASAESLLEERGIPLRNELLMGAKARRTWQETLAIVWKHIMTETTGTDSMDDNNGDDVIRCNMSASQVLEELRGLSNDGNDSQATQVFVTGSLYLVGSFLTALKWSEESSPPLN